MKKKIKINRLLEIYKMRKSELDDLTNIVYYTHNPEEDHYNQLERLLISNRNPTIESAEKKVHELRKEMSYLFANLVNRAILIYFNSSDESEYYKIMDHKDPVVKFRANRILMKKLNHIYLKLLKTNTLIYLDNYKKQLNLDILYGYNKKYINIYDIYDYELIRDIEDMIQELVYLGWYDK